MPIYAYRCEACGHELDALQKISDAPLTDCPECGAAALKKQITAAAFRLKGAGWYETDFKKDGKKNLHDSGEKDKASGQTGDKSADKKAADKKSDTPKTAKADSKPAAKPAAAATSG
jgi:putative FmdB family regulatory protein